MVDATEKFVGLDGYPKGWVAVWLYNGGQQIEYLRSIRELIDRDFKIAMIDMPIGLPDQGYRDCDSQARERLGSNRSRVFLGARRSFLDFQDYREANKNAKALDGKGVSKQLFGITKKLRELDGVVTPELQQRIMECHPELVFWRLNREQPVPQKKKIEGIEQRKRLLENQGITGLESLLETRIGRGAKIDDVLDACACAIAARDNSPLRPPLGGASDSKGLKMEIHY